MAAANDERVRDALSLVLEAGLPHPVGPLLCAFVEEALDPGLAATYIKQNCERGDKLQKQAALLASDWQYIVECVSKYGTPPSLPDAWEAMEIPKRDGERCCVTGKAPTFKDPLVLAPILPVPRGWTKGQPRIHDMLGAFFSPSYRDWWLAYIRDPAPSRISCYHNHWLVRKSAAKALADGTIRLQRLYPSLVQYKIEHISIGTLGNRLEVDGLFPLLGDHSRSAIPHVDPRFVGTQARLAPSIRWLAVSNRIAQNSRVETLASTSVRAKGTRLGAWPPWVLLQNACLSAWRLLPARMRVAAYQVLRMVGRRLYGTAGNLSTVQRLPFGLYLKYQVDPGEVQNEFNTLDMIRRNTSIPVPVPVDFAIVPSRKSFFSHDAYLLTTCLPGTPLIRCDELLSDGDLRNYIGQMQGFLAQLRRIPKTVSPEFDICNTSGGAIQDHRIRDGQPVGPFVDEVAFNQLLRNPDDPSRQNHRVFFTHADLNLRNILVGEVTRADGSTGWEVTGIVDWENAGYYPEYWEYTKALFESFRYNERARRVIHDVFRELGDYSKEVEVEKRSWEEGDYI